MQVVRRVDVISPDDVRVVQRGDGPGLSLESLDGGRVGRQPGRQHFDRRAAAHDDVLGQVDLAHAADADGSEDGVLAGDQKRLPLAVEEPVGLERGEQSVADEAGGEFTGVLGRPLGGGPADLRVEQLDREQPALAEAVEEAVGGDGGHLRAPPVATGKGLRGRGYGFWTVVTV